MDVCIPDWKVVGAVCFSSGAWQHVGLEWIESRGQVAGATSSGLFLEHLPYSKWQSLCFLCKSFRLSCKMEGLSGDVVPSQKSGRELVVLKTSILLSISKHRQYVHQIQSFIIFYHDFQQLINSHFQVYHEFSSGLCISHRGPPYVPWRDGRWTGTTITTGGLLEDTMFLGLEIYVTKNQLVGWQKPGFLVVW